jgi:hypothetical protein
MLRYTVGGAGDATDHVLGPRIARLTSSLSAWVENVSQLTSSGGSTSCREEITDIHRGLVDVIS